MPMKMVTVDFVKAEVASYDPQTEEFTFHFTLNDGAAKMFAKKMKLTAPADQGEQVFKDVRERIKKAHASSGEDFLDSVVTVRFKQEEDMVMERLAQFFVNSRDRARSMSRAKVSRFDQQNKMARFSTDFIIKGGRS